MPFGVNLDLVEIYKKEVHIFSIRGSGGEIFGGKVKTLTSNISETVRVGETGFRPKIKSPESLRGVSTRIRYLVGGPPRFLATLVEIYFFSGIPIFFKLSEIVLGYPSNMHKNREQNRDSHCRENGF